MPRLWFSHDVAPARGGSLQISFTDFNMAFGARRVRFLPDGPAQASLVLLQVGPDELMPPLFLHAGYYVIEGISASAAREALREAGIED